MNRLIRTISLLFVIAITCTFFGCGSVKYTTPKNKNDIALKKSIDRIMANIKSECSTENKNEIEKIGIKFNRKSITVTTNTSRSLLFIPTYTHMTKKSAFILSSHLDDTCIDDEHCKKELKDYLSSYYLIHELFHTVNPHRYKRKFEGSVVKKKLKLRMSFDEELMAESVVVKYLSKYNPTKLSELNEVFTNILQIYNFSKNHNDIKANWNNFSQDYFQNNLTKLYFFTHSYDKVGDGDLEDLLFPLN